MSNRRIYRLQVVSWGAYANGPREGLLQPDEERHDTYVEALDALFRTMKMVEDEREDGDEPVELEIVEEEVEA